MDFVLIHIDLLTLYFRDRHKYFSVGTGCRYFEVTATWRDLPTSRSDGPTQERILQINVLDKCLDSRPCHLNLRQNLSVYLVSCDCISFPSLCVKEQKLIK
jgi:hypothetical protein